MQPTDAPLPKRPQHKSPVSPKVFYSDSVGCSALRIILIHKLESACLGGAFQFQCLAGQIIAKTYTFEAADYDENSLHTVCIPAATHEPILFRASATTPPLLPEQEDVLCKRLKAIDFKFDPIKDAIINHGFSAILLVTDPPAKIKPIESITGWTIFKPLPKYEPVELSPYYYMTNLVLEPNRSNVYEFCKSVHHMWNSSSKSIAMIIGPKDSGKSTISKELCNILLSSRPHHGSTIYYLDCDVGQSEFTPPGLLSIVKVEKPILSAPFATQISTFYNSYYFGDISPAGDMDLYISILKQCFTEFFEMCRNDSNALLMINTLGWVENFGKDILDNLVKIFSPGCLLALRRGLFIHVPKNASRVFYDDAHIVPDNRKISPPKLRDLAITGYFTQCFLKSMNLEVVSFSDVSVRMISFEKIGIFIHPSHLVSAKAYLAALNMSTVALCTVPDKFKKNFKWQKLCDKENLPFKVEYADRTAAKPFFKCIGYGLVRAISIEKQKIYIITPADPSYLVDVNVLAIGNDIHTPHWIFQTQNSANAPYLMHTRNQTNDFDRLSMPLKIVGMHKRNVFRNR